MINLPRVSNLQKKTNNLEQSFKQMILILESTISSHGTPSSTLKPNYAITEIA